MNRVKYAALVEMMQGISDDELTMSKKRFVLPSIGVSSVMLTHNNKTRQSNGATS